MKTKIFTLALLSLMFATLVQANNGNRISLEIPPRTSWLAPEVPVEATFEDELSATAISLMDMVKLAPELPAEAAFDDQPDLQWLAPVVPQEADFEE
jgi:hypothetical protein